MPVSLDACDRLAKPPADTFPEQACHKTHQQRALVRTRLQENVPPQQLECVQHPGTDWVARALGSNRRLHRDNAVPGLSALDFHGELSATQLRVGGGLLVLASETVGLRSPRTVKQRVTARREEPQMEGLR